MNQRDESNLIRAYADGELPPDEQAAFTQRMAEDPELMLRVLDEQRLRAAVASVAKRHAPATPQDLRDRLAAMDIPEQSAQPAQPSQPLQTAQPAAVARMSPWSRWVPLAAAAVVLLAAMVTFQAARNADQPGPASAIAQVGLGDRKAEKFAMRHLQCSRDPSELQGDPSLPSSADALDQAIATRLDAPVSGLDLSGIGYRFVKVGHCTIPSRESLHLIYEAINPSDDRPHRISLWVAPHTGERSNGLAPGKVHRLELPGSDLPLVLWSDGRMNYYLVADTHLDAEAAADALRADKL